VPVTWRDFSTEQARLLSLAPKKISGSWDEQLLHASWPTYSRGPRVTSPSRKLRTKVASGSAVRQRPTWRIGWVTGWGGAFSFIVEAFRLT
jgi:hypothetical protein